MQTELQSGHLVFIPFTYAAMASAVSLSGSMVMRMGVMFGIDDILSVENMRNNMFKKKKLLFHVLSS